jgi:DNA primase
MIPNTFNEETEFLIDSNLNSFKRHCMTYYWKARKDFLDYIQNSHDSFIGSTISTRSKKNVSCASKMSSPSVLSHDTKTSKVSEKDNPHDFTLRTSILHFYPNLTLKDTGTMLRRKLKKIRIT